MVAQACNPSTWQRQEDQKLKVTLSYIENLRSASRGPMFKKRKQQQPRTWWFTSVIPALWRPKCLDH